MYNITKSDKKLENDISSFSNKSFYLSHERKLLGLVNDMIATKQLYEGHIETKFSNFTQTDIENIKEILNLLDLNN